MTLKLTEITNFLKFISDKNLIKMFHMWKSKKIISGNFEIHFYYCYGFIIKDFKIDKCQLTLVSLLVLFEVNKFGYKCKKWKNIWKFNFNRELLLNKLVYRKMIRFFFIALDFLKKCVF